jgi:hypothetical protein
MGTARPLPPVQGEEACNRVNVTFLTEICFVARCRVDVLGYGTEILMKFCDYGTESSGSIK